MQGEVLSHGEFFVERERLRHIADAHPRRHAARVHRRAEQLRRAAGRLQQAGEHFHRRRFAAAVAAEEAENLALLDGEADVIDRGEVAEALGEVVRLDGRWQRRVRHERRQIQPARALLFFRRQQTDVGLFEVGVSGHDVARRRVYQQLARVHRPQLRERLRFFDVGGGDQHRHSRRFALQVAHQRPELAARQRVNAGGWFVQNQQIGRMHQRAAQARLLLHPAGELAGGAVGKGREAGRFQQSRNAGAAFARGQAKEAGVKVDVFIDRQRRIEIAPQSLRHIGDAVRQRLAVGGLSHIAAKHVQLAALNAADTGDEREQGRFADAVRADEADGQPARQGERKVVKRQRLAVAVGEVGNGEGGHKRLPVEAAGETRHE